MQQRTAAAGSPPRRARADGTEKPKLRLHLIRGRDPRSKQDPVAAARTSVLLLLVPTALLTAIGIVMVLSASSVTAISECGSGFCFFTRQVVYAVVGVAAMGVTARMEYRRWQQLALPFLLASVILLILALHPTSGVSAYGASRWIVVGPVTVQPSELAKLALITFAATVLTKKWKHLDEPVHLVIPLAPVVAIVSMLVQVGLQEPGENVGVAPAGRPEAAKLTACVAPETNVAVIVFEPDDP